MREACEAFGTPVTGGNVSFYNESGDERDLADAGDRDARAPAGLPAARADRLPRGGLAMYLAGETSRSWAVASSPRSCSGSDRGQTAGAGPRRASGRLLRFLVEAADDTVLASAHDCSDGGLAIALAEVGDPRRPRVRGDAAGRPAPARVPVQRIRVAGGARRRRRRTRSACSSSRPRVTAVPLAPDRRDRRATGGVDGMFEATVDELRDAWELAIPRLLGEAS